MRERAAQMHGWPRSEGCEIAERDKKLFTGMDENKPIWALFVFITVITPLGKCRSQIEYRRGGVTMQPLLPGFKSLKAANEWQQMNEYKKRQYNTYHMRGQGSLITLGYGCVSRRSVTGLINSTPPPAHTGSNVRPHWKSVLWAGEANTRLQNSRQRTAAVPARRYFREGSVSPCQ